MNLTNIIFRILLIYLKIYRFYLINKFLIRNLILIKNKFEIKLNKLFIVILKADNIKIFILLLLIILI